MQTLVAITILISGHVSGHYTFKSLNYDTCISNRSYVIEKIKQQVNNDKLIVKYSCEEK